MPASSASPLQFRATLPAVVTVNAYRRVAVLASATGPGPVRVRRVGVRSQGPHCWVIGAPLSDPVNPLVHAGEWRVVATFVLRVSGAAPQGEHVLELRAQVETGDGLRWVQEVLRVAVRHHVGCCG